MGKSYKINFNGLYVNCHVNHGSQLLILYISTDKITFPENLDDSFQQGLLGSLENACENTIQTGKLHLSQASSRCTGSPRNPKTKP